MLVVKGGIPMNKDIEALINKRVKNILSKDVLDDEDIKFLILYKRMNQPTLLDRVIGSTQKIMKFINSNDEGSDK